MNENERNFISLEVIENLLGKDRIEVLAEEALKSNVQWYLRDKRNLDNLIYDLRGHLVGQIALAASSVHDRFNNFVLHSNLSL